jgi:hypothetical protein
MKRLKFKPATPYTIQLDIDNNADLKLFFQHLGWLSCIMNETKQELRGISLERSRSGKHWHAEISLSKPLPVMTRIALAAIMGSDRSRELCNFERVQFKSPYPILFFKKENSK